MSVGLSIRDELLGELSRLKQTEAGLDNELLEVFSSLTLNKQDGHSSSSSSSSISEAASSSSRKGSAGLFNASELSSSVRKVEMFAPCFEAMVQDSKKLVLQVEDCRALSDRLSVMVRRLDLMQSRAQLALSCTEDILSLKECKVKMQSAIEDGNLPLAVGYIRQVHSIDKQISTTSDDYTAILAAEQTVKGMVQAEFANAIQTSDLDKVIALCPLLQTLGLEAEARDSFLDFIESTVFIGVSADASAVDGATDAATGYAQALSNIFNSTYVILQQYLPMVIQGLERSLGDVYFIKRLHAKCELEAGLVLKRYFKYRGVQALVSSLASASGSSSSGGGGGGGSGGGTGAVQPADVHAMLDELALLIQYCCLYSRYLKQLCAGAESRQRASSDGDNASASGPGASATTATAAAVFPGPIEFDTMVDEMVNKYYMEGERFLLNAAVRSAFPRSAMDSSEGAASSTSAGLGLDECFFVMQRCCQRAVATNTIHAACAVLHSASDLLASQMLARAGDSLSSAVNRAATHMGEHLSRMVGRPLALSLGPVDGQGGLASVSRGLKTAMSLASSITAGGGASAGVVAADTAAAAAGDVDEDDRWGMARHLEVFNAVERCARYTDRLGRDVGIAAETVFAAGSSSGSSSGSGHSAAAGKKSSSSTGAGTGAGTGSGTGSGSSEMDKLRLCKEGFEAAKLAFSQVRRACVGVTYQHSVLPSRFLILSLSGPSLPTHPHPHPHAHPHSHPHLHHLSLISRPS